MHGDSWLWQDLHALSSLVACNAAEVAKRWPCYCSAATDISVKALSLPCNAHLPQLLLTVQARMGPCVVCDAMMHYCSYACSSLLAVALSLCATGNYLSSSCQVLWDEDP